MIYSGKPFSWWKDLYGTPLTYESHRCFSKLILSLNANVLEIHVIYIMNTQVIGLKCMSAYHIILYYLFIVCRGERGCVRLYIMQCLHLCISHFGHVSQYKPFIATTQLIVFLSVRCR